MQPKVVLITGASSGIGLEVAKQLMQKGWCVYAASRRGGNYQKSEKSSGEIIPVKMDVNIDEEIKVVLSQIIAEYGYLNAVVCNAGNGIAGSIEDTSEEETRYQFETNFFGAVKTVQACLPIFRKQGYGKIMATSSVGGIVPLPFQAFYSASKAALYTFMQALTMEVKAYGIQCCSVLPGDTHTDFTSSRKYTVNSQSPDSAYNSKMKKSVGKMEKDELNGMKAEYIAKKMVRQITRKKMKLSVIPGIQYKLICWAYSILPNRLRLWIVGLLY